MADNFTPGETVSLTAGTTSASASFTLAQSANYPDCMITNTGSNIAFVGFGGAPATLPGAGATNAVPIMPGETYVLRKGVGVTEVNAITQTSTTTLYLTAGEGQ